MSTILLAWELGGGMGHLAPHREMISSLLERGHKVHVAARDVGRAGIAFEGLPMHVWPVPLTLDPPTKVYLPTVSLAHILSNSGFAKVGDVSTRIAAWRNLFAAIQPDLLISDYSPTALLAVRGSHARAIIIGTGFCIPPNCAPLPSFATLAQMATSDRVANDEDRLTQTINAALGRHKLPAIRRLADIFHETDAQILTTIAELDHYPDRGPADYWGLPSERPGKLVKWLPGMGRRVFAYLKPFPAIEALFDVLNQLGLPSIVACDGLSAGLRQKHSSANLTFVDADVDLARASQECYVAITNANHTTTARFLLAGKPVLMIPLQLEQELVAWTASRQDLGVTVRPNEPQLLFPKLAELVNSRRSHDAAANLAAKYASERPNRLERLLELIESLCR